MCVNFLGQLSLPLKAIVLFIYKRKHWDFPGGPVVKKPPSYAGDTGSIPGRRTKIPHAAGQLSPCTTIAELVCHNY